MMVISQIFVFSSDNLQVTHNKSMLRLTNSVSSDPMHVSNGEYQLLNVRVEKPVLTPSQQRQTSFPRIIASVWKKYKENPELAFVGSLYIDWRQSAQVQAAFVAISELKASLSLPSSSSSSSSGYFPRNLYTMDMTASRWQKHEQ